MTNKYRGDIDGLRAIAVAQVVLFHAGVTLFTGGYVGVDVFFVISGYLISDILWRELRADKFSLLGFYDRRARRILPALSITLLATTLLGWVLFIPAELHQLGKNVVASIFAAGNVVALANSGYFAGNSQDNPLLHTWSLAIEEQFYVVWPLLLLLCWRYFKGRSWPLWLLTLGSLAAAEWGVHHYSSATFYLLPTRAWELSLGGVLAISPRLPELRPPLRAGVVALGLGAIVYAGCIYTPATPFPGLTALVPTGGAALIVAFGGRGDLVSQLLASSPLVWLGKRSYSLYLWHWPLLAALRVHLNRSLSLGEALFAVAAALLLAEASFRWVETPFRESGTRLAEWLRGSASSRATRPRSLAVAAGVIAGIAGLGALVMRAQGGLPKPRLEAVARFEAARRETTRSNACHRMAGVATVPPATECTFGSAAARHRVLLWGDSHADHYRPTVERVATARGMSLRQATKSACPPISGDLLVVDRSMPTPDCALFNEAVLDVAVSDPEIEVVALAGRWAFYTDGRIGGLAGDSDVFITTPDRPRALSRDRSAQLLEQGLAETIERLDAAGKSVVLLAQTPEYPFDVPACLAREAGAGRSSEHCEISRGSAEARAGRSDQQLARLAARYPRLALLLPLDTWCTAGVCPALRGQVVMIRDSNHMTKAGALELAPALTRVWPEPQAALAMPRGPHLVNARRGER
ncbi:MAG TPA: acyltransferase family protein [Polyangiaceae bacterium]|nr:acyltransferase family protein [Polyangiaceae bacterium]